MFVNGRHLGRHRGAFTRFLFDATDALAEGENVLAVRADNDLASTAESLPSGASRQLYNLYGGIYRKVRLLVTGPLHVDPTDHAASGVFVTTRKVTRDSAFVSVRVLLRNAGTASRTAAVRAVLRDREGAEAAVLEGREAVPAGGRAALTLETRVDRPHLWAPGDPYLYRVATEVRDDGRPVDEVTERVGFRDFRFVDGRFLLNGAPLLLRGVGKHQETEARLSAVTDDDLRDEFATLGDLGVNMVRLAHYPHAPLEYDLADERGILVWAENGHSNPAKVKEAGDEITREMVRQNYNHPSIVIWSVGNETAFLRVNRYAEIVRAEDPSRVIAYASNTGTRPRKHYPEIDLITQNTYRGWYRGEPWDFEATALAMRYISENGGGSVITSHDGRPEPRHEVDVFEPEEYRQVLEEVHDQVVFREHAADIPMYLEWNFRDFGVDKYKGVRNTKGLLTAAGFRKDAYYLYRSFLRPEEPTVFLTGKTYFLRRAATAGGVKAYSNRPRLALTVNGAAIGERANGAYHHPNGRVIANVFAWPDALRLGRNEVKVSDGAGHEDAAVLYFLPPGTPAAPPEDALVRDLRSSNPKSPAFFVDAPAQAQWPFYWELDGTADNSFDALPPAVEGAAWIATRRLSKREARTTLAFTLGAPGAAVFVMASASDALAGSLAAAGFSDTGVGGRWRDDALALVPFRVFRREAGPGERVSVPAATADYVVLVKRGVESPAAPRGGR